jgi:hypothetical protein
MTAVITSLALDTTDSRGHHPFPMSRHTGFRCLETPVSYVLEHDSLARGWSRVSLSRVRLAAVSVKLCRVQVARRGSEGAAAASAGNCLSSSDITRSVARDVASSSSPKPLELRLLAACIPDEVNDGALSEAQPATGGARLLI